MYTVDSQFFEPSIFSNLPTTLTKSRFPPISRTMNFTIDFFKQKFVSLGGSKKFLLDFVGLSNNYGSRLCTIED